ncbi:MAG: GntR family transcriptional regulator [Stackebrandtia sp.]
MQLTLDVDSEIPIYQQIRDQVVLAIATGELAAGSPLPSSRQLGTDLAINFHTVSKAYDLLRREGFIRINRKSGTVVRRDRDSGPPEAEQLAEWDTRLRTLLAEALAHGLNPERVLDHAKSQLDSFTTGARTNGATR